MRLIEISHPITIPAATFRFASPYVNSRICARTGARRPQLSSYGLFATSNSSPHACRIRISSFFDYGRRPTNSFQGLINATIQDTLRDKRCISSTSRTNSTITQCQVHDFSGTEWTTENVEIPVGGNGFVRLDIMKVLPPAKKTGARSHETRNILVYLPPGPLLRAETKSGPDAVKDLLNTITNCRLPGVPNSIDQTATVIQINYRLSPSTGRGSSAAGDRFPTPIHDVAIAFDWIMERIKAEIVQADRESKTGRDCRMHVAGSSIGGSLALMLALTQPNDIHAVAVRDPVVDWVSLDELAAPTKKQPMPSPTNKRRAKSESEESKIRIQQAAEALIELRTALFRNPSGFFDPFASPLLFLRAPGRDTPTWRTAKPEPEGDEANADDTIEVLKMDGGVQVDEKETAEIVRERGYGPYDDDWHTVESEFDADEGRTIVSDLASPAVHDVQQITKDLSTLQLAVTPALASQESRSVLSTVQPSTDLSPARQHDLESLRTRQLSAEPSHPTTTSSSPGDRFPSLSPTSLTTPTSAADDSQLPPRRRKVLRRWPPTGRPEDVDLPYVKIYSTSFRSSPSNEGEKSTVDLSHVLNSQAQDMVDVMRRACFWGREKGLGEARVTLEETDVEQMAGKESGAHGEVDGKEVEKVDNDPHEENVPTGEGYGNRQWVVKAVDWLCGISSVEK